MKNIVLARVDDRLIHTEILTLWVPEVRANRIIIVDDVVAKDKFRSKVIKEMAPQGLIIHVYGIDRATEKLKEAPSFDGERVIVIAESNEGSRSISLISEVWEFVENVKQLQEELRVIPWRWKLFMN
jgi:mannose/fructose/N-acetylgalactosamine-specific phosphotransferase system component IIB